MNDCISRKAVMELIESKLTDGHLQMGDDIPLIDAAELMDDVTCLPAAYDVDRVVEQLEAKCSEYQSRIDWRENEPCYHNETEKIRILNERMFGVEQAIDIVRGGGVDE